jgi:GGDEF domain-containing protein
MPASPFYDGISRLLTRETFSFMFDHELKHALRTQDFLTLVVITAEHEWRGLFVAAEERIVKELGGLLAGDLRETDLLARTADGVLSLLLLGVDLERAKAVIDRVVEQIKSSELSRALLISVGAACCPTHARGAQGLSEEARLRRRCEPSTGLN